MAENVVCNNCKYFFGFNINNEILNVNATIKYYKKFKISVIICSNCTNILGVDMPLICKTCWVPPTDFTRMPDIVESIKKSHINFTQNGCKKCLEFKYKTIKFFDNKSINFSKNNLEENKNKFLVSELSENECLICLKYGIVSQLKDCCNKLICLDCLQKLNSCPFCRKLL